MTTISRMFRMAAASLAIVGLMGVGAVTGATEPLSPTPQAQAAPAKAQGTLKATAVLNKWKASKGASRYSGTIPRGTTLTWLGTSANGRMKVSYQGRTIWVTARYAPRSSPWGALGNQPPSQPPSPSSTPPASGASTGPLPPFA